MVLVTEIRAFMLLRPARVLVLLAVLGRLGFPVFRHLAVLDRLVLLARTEGPGYRIVLLGRRYDRSIDDLPAPGEIALVFQESIEQVEQFFHRARLGQRLAIEPQSLGLGNRSFETNGLKTHERACIAKLMFP